MRPRIPRWFTEWLSPATLSAAEAGPDRHFRRNFLVNAGDGILWLFGESFVSLNAILPVYASRLTTSPLIIGLIPALADAGWFLPQVFLAPYIKRRRRKLPAFALLGALERLPYLALALAALWLSSLRRDLAVAIFLLVLTWRALAGGLVAMPWQELIASVIPVSHRGRFFGLTYWAGQLLGVAGAALAALILHRFPYPHNYALCFFIAFLSLSLSYLLVLLTVEPPPQGTSLPASRHGSYAGRLRSILRQDRNFRNFLVSRWLGYLGGMAYGFVAVQAVRRFALPDAQAAVFTAILFGSGVVGYPLWGVLGDRTGHKRVLVGAGMLWSLALVLALLAPSVLAFHLVFAVMGLSSSGAIIGDLTLPMEFGPTDERPTYVGLARTAMGPVALLTPLLGGAILMKTSFPILLLVSLAFTISGAILLLTRVQDPRCQVHPAH